MAGLGIDLHDEAARERIERLFWQLAQSLLGLGVSVILESGFWVREDRDEKRLGARALGVAMELHYLEVPIDELWRRIEVHNGEGSWGTAPITRAQIESYVGFFHAPEPAELAQFDDPAVSCQA